MSEQDNIKLIQENMDAFNANDMDRFRATLTDGAVYEEFGTHRRVEGADDWIDVLQGWKQAFPNAEGTITNVFSSGNQGIAEVMWRGTHTGDLVGPEGTIPASGKSVELKASMVSTVQEGKIAQANHYFDMATLMQQIGAAQ